MSKNILDKKLVGRMIAGSFLMGGFMATVSQVYAKDSLSGRLAISEEEDEETPEWYRAIEGGDVEGLQDLIDQGLVTGTAPYGVMYPATPALQVAIWYDRFDMVYMLLEANVDINERNDDGNTVLQALMALAFGIPYPGEASDPEILLLARRLLRTQGINLTLRNNNGETAYDFARELITEELVTYGNLTQEEYDEWMEFLQELYDATRAQLEAIGEGIGEEAFE